MKQPPMSKGRWMNPDLLKWGLRCKEERNLYNGWKARDEEQEKLTKETK